MQTRPPLKLSRLRDIGFAEWDPIGLLAAGERWDHQPFADEYDRYLLEVAGGLGRDWSRQDAIDYLVRIEREYMGLGMRPTTLRRAEATAAAIKAYLESIGGQL